jgi:hypothetical protein
MKAVNRLSEAVWPAGLASDDSYLGYNSGPIRVRASAKVAEW